MLQKIINGIRVGFRIYPYNEDWDLMLNQLLDDYRIIKVDEHHATLDNGSVVWIANKWYAYGAPCPNKTLGLNILPSPTTAIRLYNATEDLKNSG